MMPRAAPPVAFQQSSNAGQLLRHKQTLIPPALSLQKHG
ncbi:MAG: hypothetical protein EBU96_09540 [Actinobacteria bacterium]|nr:hypothetical protein [Actinomycetota bacterium]